jgi:hypothetical protein
LADFVDNTVKDIDSRLGELKLEVKKLEAARAVLVGERRGPGRPRGRRGGNTRANQALQLVGEKPGITIPQIADSLKIEPNYLYRVMPRLVEDGSVRRDGQGWHAVSSNGA